MTAPRPLRTEPSPLELGVSFWTVCTERGQVYYAGLMTDGVRRALDGMCRQCEARQCDRDAALGRKVRRYSWLPCLALCAFTLALTIYVWRAR